MLEQEQLVDKLSNILKLPKAQRWMCCEWFYSDIDKGIFASENDFSLCLNQSFPRLKTRKMTRKQWCFIRRLIGKPRRCSDAFFHEERQSLLEKREKIRLIQHRKINEKDINEYKDIPQELPLPLSIGHRVYAHIRSPECGVFLGTIGAVDPVEHTYRVVFDRSSIGSQTVADYEVKSLTPVQTIPIKAYMQTYRPKSTQVTPHKFLQTPTNAMFLLDELHNTVGLSSSGLVTPQTSNLIMQSHLANNLLNDPMLGVSSPMKLGHHDDAYSQYMSVEQSNTDPNTNVPMLGGFPLRLLGSITRLNKLLNMKKDQICKLGELNTEAEHIKVNKNYYTKEFQLKYASLVIDIEKINKDLSECLVNVQRYCEEYAPDLKGFFTSLGSNNSESIHKKALIESREMVTRLNKTSTNAKIVKTTSVVDLVTKLTSIILQIRDYANAGTAPMSDNSMNEENLNESNATTTTNERLSQMLLDSSGGCVETKSINLTIEEIKASLSTSNKKIFEDKVQVHVNHIQSALNYYSNLHVFKETDDSLMNMINNRGGASGSSSLNSNSNSSSETGLSTNMIKNMITINNNNNDSLSSSSYM